MTNQTNITFQENGSPYSEQFDDIYFDTESGYQQSQHVFIDGNHLFERLSKLKSSFTIAETGFGTGINFLLTLQVYQRVLQQQLKENAHFDAPPLTFISVEKYPLSKEQLARSLAIFPELSHLSAPLIAQYPNNSEKECHLSFFEGKVKLTLYFTDATHAFSQLKTKKTGLVDAWYLDGFSPRKNPDMWSKDLFEQVARLSKDQTTLATFTIAGIVRRNLQEVGFRLEKITTSGQKQEILQARYQQNTNAGKGFQLRPRISKPQHVAIIGGGIASACAAYSLTKQGVKVTLYCKDNKIAQGASSNAIGALYPLLHQQKDDISEFYQQAFWHAKALYKTITDHGHSYKHQWCGLLEVSYKKSIENRQKLFEEINAWPRNLIHSIDQKQAVKVSGIPLKQGGLFMPEAGWICPPDLVFSLFEAAKKTNRLRIENGLSIKRIDQNCDGTWQLHSDRKSFKESVLIICGGADSIKINIINELPLTSVRGQVTSMKTNKQMEKLSTVICHKGYLTPASNNQHCIGATFDKNSFNTEALNKDDDFNLRMLESCLPDLTHWRKEDVVKGKARLRCMTPDHLPMVGAMPDIEAHKNLYGHLRKDKNWKYNQAAPMINNLYIMTGLGARGLCSAPLIADILCADICGTPYPVSSKMLFNLSPNRFVIRDLIKRKV